MKLAAERYLQLSLAVLINIERQGNDLVFDLPLSFSQAALGGEFQVPTPYGDERVRVPSGTQTNTVLRLKGKGLYGDGDLYVNLKVVLPPGGDPDLEALMRFMRESKPYKVRDN